MSDHKLVNDLRQIAEDHPRCEPIISWTIERLEQLTIENGNLYRQLEEMDDLLKKRGKELMKLGKDQRRLDFLGDVTGSGWATLHLHRENGNEEWLLTREEIDKRIASEP